MLQNDMNPTYPAAKEYFTDQPNDTDASLNADLIKFKRQDGTVSSGSR